MGMLKLLTFKEDEEILCYQLRFKKQEKIQNTETHISNLFVSLLFKLLLLHHPFHFSFDAKHSQIGNNSPSRCGNA